MRENTQAISPSGLRTEPSIDGINVIGEAVKRVTPESAEFLIEITTSAPTAAQSLRDNQVKTKLVTQAVGLLGVQPADIQTISLNVYNLYSPLALPGFSVAPQIGPVGFAPHAAASAAQPEMSFSPYDLQYGAYYTRNTVRVNVREAGRVGEVVDAAVKGGAGILGAFALRVSDDPAARRAALEAAGRDARAKAEALAAAAGKQLGDAVAITEEIVASNGTYMALRAAQPFAFGAGAPQTAGELEYYARISARFGLT